MTFVLTHFLFKIAFQAFLDTSFSVADPVSGFMMMMHLSAVGVLGVDRSRDVSASWLRQHFFHASLSLARAVSFSKLTSGASMQMHVARKV